MVTGSHRYLFSSSRSRTAKACPAFPAAATCGISPSEIGCRPLSPKCRREMKSAGRISARPRCKSFFWTMYWTRYRAAATSPDIFIAERRRTSNRTKGPASVFTNPARSAISSECGRTSATETSPTSGRFKSERFPNIHPRGTNPSHHRNTEKIPHARTNRP